jgi:hypothetical protein
MNITFAKKRVGRAVRRGTKSVPPCIDWRPRRPARHAGAVLPAPSSACLSAMTVHLRKHEAVQDYGSYEVWFDDGRPSKFFYFDDLPNRRLRPDIVTKAQARDTALI